MKILVVDDEKDIVDLISFNLQKEGYEVLIAHNGEEALELLKHTRPDLITLDLMLPGMQGLEVCREIRKNPELALIPIIMITAKSSEIDRIIGLEMGADDYLSKPFSIRELTARISVLFRRMKAQQTVEKAEKSTFSTKDLFINYDAYEFSMGGEKIELSPMESKLLIFLTKNPGRVYSRDQILDRIWQDNTFVTPRSVDVHISRLRSLLEKDPRNPDYILTVRGAGYKFNDSENESKAHKTKRKS